MFDNDTLAKQNLEIAKEDDTKLIRSMKKQRLAESRISDEVLKTRTTICTDLDYNPYKSMIKGIKKYVPRTIWTVLGCDGCEWRGTKDCPSGITKRPTTVFGKSAKNCPITHRHGNGICDTRKDFLYLIGGEWKKHPTHDMWMSRYNKRLMALESGQDYVRLQRVRQKLEDMELRIENGDKVDPKELEVTKKEHYFARKAWLELADLFQNYTDKQVDRETPKNLDVKVEHHVKPSDVTKILNQANRDVIDITPEDD